MVGGSYYVTTGQWSHEAAWLGLLYGLGPTVVLFGKHIDKIDLDEAKGVRTLPVILGEGRARVFARMLLVAQYAGCLALVVTGQEHWLLLAVFLTTPTLLRTLKRFAQPKPDARPKSFPANIWPLWFAPHAFALTRRFMPVFVAALLLAEWIPF
jgi:1,4-dihydroxy-2-naphthoate octaprenyltransferase